MSAYVATIAVANGAVTGTYIENNAGTITTGNPTSGTWSVANGVVTSTAFTAGANGTGAVSADGDLIVLADTTQNDLPPSMWPCVAEPESPRQPSRGSIACRNTVEPRSLRCLASDHAVCVRQRNL